MVDSIPLKEHLMIDFINKDLNPIVFGQIIRLLRIRYGYALRDLAQRIHISHTYLKKIEKGEVTITKDIYENIALVFNLKLQSNKEKDQRFEDYKNKLEEYIIYIASESKIHLIKELEQDEAYYINSMKMIDYYILKLAVYNHLVYGTMQDIAPIANEFDRLMGLLSIEQKQKVLVYTGIYYYNLSDFEESVRRLNEAATLIPGNLNAAMAKYLIGRNLSETFKISQAIDYLESASLDFERYSIQDRIMHCKILLYINKMKIGVLDNVVDKFNEITLLTNSLNLRYIRLMVDYNYAIYYLLKEDYQNMLDKINEVKTINSRYYYYKAVALLKLGRMDEALDTVNALDTSFDTQKHKMVLYHRGLEFIKAYILYLRNDDIKSYGKAIKRFYDAAMHVQAYVDIRFLFEYYVEFFKNQRRYKEAFLLTKQLIEIEQKTIQ